MPLAKRWSHHAGERHLPSPTDLRLQQITIALLADPADDRDLVEWGRHVGAGVRTLTRLFSIETGMSFVQWRTQARMSAALAALADGRAVSEVARMVGYSTSSSFAHAFRRHTGSTPSAYLDVVRHPAPARPAKPLPDQ